MTIVVNGARIDKGAINVVVDGTGVNDDAANVVEKAPTVVVNDTAGIVVDGAAGPNAAVVVNCARVGDRTTNIDHKENS